MQLQIKIFELVANELHSHLGSFTCTRSLRAEKSNSQISRQLAVLQKKWGAHKHTNRCVFFFDHAICSWCTGQPELRVLPQNLLNGFKGQVRQHTGSRDLAKTLEDPWHEGARAFVVLWFPHGGHLQKTSPHCFMQENLSRMFMKAPRVHMLWAYLWKQQLQQK